MPKRQRPVGRKVRAATQYEMMASVLIRCQNADASLRCSESSAADEGGEAIAKLQRVVDDIKAQARRDKARKRQAIVKVRG